MTCCRIRASSAARVAALILCTGCGANPPRSIRSHLEATPAPLTPVEREKLVAALDTIAAHLPDSTALCLTLMGGPGGSTPADSQLLATLRTRQRPVRGTDCQPTYTRMVRYVDSLGRSLDPPRPPDYLDPYQLTVGRT